MNDDLLLAKIESVANPVMRTPVEAVVARGRQLRRRRRLAATGVVGVTALALALVAPVFLPASGPFGTPSAWAVDKAEDGVITITVREMSDAAGLQASLLAHGLSAHVEFGSDACVYYDTTSSRIPVPHGVTGKIVSGSDEAVMVIQPSALPSGTTLNLWVFPRPGAGGQVAGLTVRANLVDDSTTSCIPAAQVPEPQK
ncbi:hypothetical protein ACWEOW_01215 [Monashia sp. NPDC004114]